jgi:hypothetical protein
VLAQREDETLAQPETEREVRGERETLADTDSLGDTDDVALSEHVPDPDFDVNGERDGEGVTTLSAVTLVDPLCLPLAVALLIADRLPDEADDPLRLRAVVGVCDSRADGPDEGEG